MQKKPAVKKKAAAPKQDASNVTVAELTLSELRKIHRSLLRIPVRIEESTEELAELVRFHREDLPLNAPVVS